MNYDDPQFTLLNIDDEYDLLNKNQTNGLNLEPWNGNSDKIYLPKKQLKLPKHINYKIKTPSRTTTQQRRRSIESIQPSHQESCPKIEMKTPTQSFQMTSLSPRKNSTHQYKQSCLKMMFKKQIQSNLLTWADYYKLIQRNHNQQVVNYNLIGYNIQPLKLEERQNLFNKFRMKIKQNTKNKTDY
ncbi:unnamed protein product [Paramecium primaurelia]|uniref:Uncharacterized protein n=1 Tax=Paramecium primaurelia TaxID=5886 RepID=A0A8S1MME4_PARPR|nr:unnamed protein product [Paramecium primaurelia]CAD8077955.1 unnamed protein product [Paramecium primaurelia]